MVAPLLVNFVGGGTGPWEITRLAPVVGPALAPAGRLAVIEESKDCLAPASWCLRGATSNERYVERVERVELVRRQQALGRREATRAALIPVRKAEAWWELTQDERRAVIEDRSAHIATGLEYLPAVARRLHHGRDLGEPFDFLTW